MFYICSKCSKISKAGFMDKLTPIPSHYREDVTLEKFDEIFHEYLCGEDKCDGGVYRVDELILPTIIELNKKGYKTQFSCSGHIWDEDGEKDKIYGTYLVLKKIKDLPEPPKSFHYKGVAQDDCIGIYMNDKIIHDSDSTQKVYGRLLDINYELLLWSIGLPERK